MDREFVVFVGAVAICAIVIAALFGAHEIYGQQVTEKQSVACMQSGGDWVRAEGSDTQYQCIHHAH